ncbi:PREDICTED: protein tramtrack, alpha isoform [Drosophila arizonae]|uniref:Protein tramtrack, alpha isoform n=1 Tax=Drosophila arizonae TaxID=7263 RepID=A0ABM1PXG5_DROAR|nr:PREDICTED: protein tramtrack, alpha isoform [Drosophila arizonae]
MLPQQYCLRWKYHHSNLQTMFSQLLDRGCFCDVTLACEGQLIRAHRVVLCACSTFFDSVLSNYASERDPIIIMKDVTFAEVKCLIEFMYKGEINVEHASLPSLLKTADDLKIKGLAEVTWRDDDDGPPPPMPAAEFHSPPRSLAESYGHDLVNQQAAHLQPQLSLAHSDRERERERERERDRERERERHSPAGLDNVLGLNAGTRLPDLTPLPSASAGLDCPATVSDPFLGPKRKRGRPPLDDTYDVFNVRKLAQYAANLEPAQRAYLESTRPFVEETLPVAHSAALASPPAACPPKQRQRLRQQQQQQQQQSTPAQMELGERELDATQDWAKESSPKLSDVELKTELELSNDASTMQATTTTTAAAGAAATAPLSSSVKKLGEKPVERRERHGKLRHATRRLYGEHEKSAEKKRTTAAASESPAVDQLTSPEPGDLRASAADVDVIADGDANADALPKPVEEIENEHLVANRADSPALLPAGGFGGKYLINDHGMLMAHDFAPNAVASAAVAAAAAAAAVAVATANGGGNNNASASGVEHAGDYAEVKLEDYDAAELRLTNEELTQWQDVIKMDDYLAKGRRPQFWEEPFTKRVLDAIKNKRLEMKKAARILGVSYGTLYGRYREVYGCLKHPYSGTTFRNSVASSAGSQLSVQPRFDLSFRSSNVLPTPLELGKLRQKDLSELWTRPQI